MSDKKLITICGALLAVAIGFSIYTSIRMTNACVASLEGQPTLQSYCY